MDIKKEDLELVQLFTDKWVYVIKRSAVDSKKETKPVIEIKEVKTEDAPVERAEAEDPADNLILE